MLWCESGYCGKTTQAIKPPPLSLFKRQQLTKDDYLPDLLLNNFNVFQDYAMLQ